MEARHVGTVPAPEVNLPAVATGYDRRPLIDGIPALADIAGAILLMLGLVGLALRPRSVDADNSDVTNVQEPSAPEVDLTPAEAYERAAKEKRRARWAERERELEGPANDRPSSEGSK